MQETPYYAMKALYPPVISEFKTTGKRYAISGSLWIEISSDVTLEMVREAWTPLYQRRVEVARSEEKTYVAKSSRTGEEYVVTQNGDNWKCTCAGFDFRRRCKHIDQFKNK